MNFSNILEIHNENFEKKTIEFFENIKNIKYIFQTKDSYLIILDSIDVYEIFEIAVRNTKKRKGLASKLLEKLPNDKDVFLEVNENNKAAINLYKKFGFEQISIRKKYYNNKDNALIMRRGVCNERI